MSGGWQAHLTSDHDDWARMENRLVLFRRLPDGGGEQIVGWSEFLGAPMIERVEEGAMLRPGFRIPAEALPSLRDQIEPGPSAAEVKRLEEALDVERRRVNDVLKVAKSIWNRLPIEPGADATPSHDGELALSILAKLIEGGVAIGPGHLSAAGWSSSVLDTEEEALVRRIFNGVTN